MNTFTLFIVLLVSWLVTRLYARATSGMTPTGQTVVDVVLTVILAFVLWGGNVRIN